MQIKASMTTEADVYEALKYHIEDDGNGTRRYRNAAGELHREDGPAVIFEGGVEQMWYRNGKLHREDGPAVAIAYSNIGVYISRWYLNGVNYTEGEYNNLRQGIHNGN